MKNASLACGLLVALLAPGCVSSMWERTEKIFSNGALGRLYVPKLYASLRPGSIYPDRRTPVPAKGRPAVIVVCPPAGKCPKKEILGPLAERGIVVLMFEGGLKEPPGEDLLRTRAESKDAPSGWLLISPTGDFLRKCMGPGAAPAAVAIIAAAPFPSPSSTSKKIFSDISLSADAAASPGSSPSSPSKQLFGSLPRRVMLAALHGSEANVSSISSDGVIERLYAPDAAGRLPREAYRDVAEWLAGELGAR